MQAQKAKIWWGIVKKVGVKNLIWMTLFSGLVVMVLGAVFYTYRHIPVAHWREYGSELPIKGLGIEITDLEATWKSSAGNSRLELRTAYYPEVRLTLGNSTGSGIIILRFIDSRRIEKGSPIMLRYSDGGFQTINDLDRKAEGKNAMVLLERGFTNPHDYRLHQLTEEEPLWRVQIFQRPADRNETFFLSERTISPTAE